MDFIKGILANIKWKAFVFNFWFNVLRPELKKIVDDTKNDYDNFILECVDFIIERTCGSAEEAEKRKITLKTK